MGRKKRSKESDPGESASAATVIELPAWLEDDDGPHRAESERLVRAGWTTVNTGRNWRAPDGEVYLTHDEASAALEKSEELYRPLPAPKTSGLELRLIPLDLIDRSPNNKRAQPKETDPEIIELAESITKSGLLQPIIVRPRGSRYQLIVGERRTVASRRAGKVTGIKAIRAFVGDVDDETAYTMTTLENLQREDLTIWEEAASCQGMLEHGWDVETAASKIGKSEAFVRRRAALVKMTKKWQALCRGEGNDAKKLKEWTPGHYELIAGLPVEEQDRLYQVLFGGWRTPETIADLRQQIAKELMILGKAPWDVEDGTLEPKAGACSACTKRSSCRPFLPSFELDAAEAAEAAPAAKDRCLDRACWDRKAARHGMQALGKLKAQNPQLRVIREPHAGVTGNDKKAIEKHAAAAGVKYHEIDYQTDKAKKTAKGAYQAAVMEPTGAIKSIGWYADKPASARGGSTGEQPKKTLQERRDQLTKRRQLLAIEKLRDEVLQKFTWSQFMQKYPKDFAERLFGLVGMLGFDLQGPEADPVPPEWEDWKKLQFTALSSMSIVMQRIWDGLQSYELHQQLQNWGTPRIEDAEAIADLIGADWPALLAEAVEALPEPKSWANHKADDKPKGGKGGKASKSADE